MGVWIRTRSFRLTDDTMRKLDEIGDAFAPMARTRTDMLRIVIDLFHSIVFSGGILERVVDSMQRLRRNTSRGAQLDLPLAEPEDEIAA